MKIERRQDAAGAWTYTDPAVQKAAVQLLLLPVEPFNLAVLDDWIEAEPDSWKPGDLERVMADRQRLIDASIAGNTEAVYFGTLYFDALILWNKREAYRHKYVKLGKQVEHKLPAEGEQRTIYTPKRSALAKRDRNERIRAATGSNAEIAAIEGMTERQVRRIRAAPA
jgi:hypothetical protein